MPGKLTRATLSRTLETLQNAVSKPSESVKNAVRKASAGTTNVVDTLEAGLVTRDEMGKLSPAPHSAHIVLGAASASLATVGAILGTDLSVTQSNVPAPPPPDDKATQHVQTAPTPPAGGISVNLDAGTATVQAPAPKPGATKPEVVWSPSANKGSRNGTPIDAIILHHTASNSTETDLKVLRGETGKVVSSHYLIGRDDKIYQLVDDAEVANHAGKSTLNGRPNVNLNSIGIEITNAGDGTPYTEGQYRALEELVAYLARNYSVPDANIVGHKDIAPDRKVDPFGLDVARIMDAVARGR